ncbi:ciliary microtubule inner protein 4 isoform 2-T3 [Podargus strigoides]
MDQLREDVLEVPTTSDVAKSDSGLANSTSVEPEEGKREHLPEGLCPSRQRTSQRSSSRASGKISKDPVAQGTAKKSTSIESQASPSAKTEKQSKQSLQAKTPSMQDLHSRRLEDKREDATKDPTVGHEQEQQALCEAALIMEQKRLNDRTEVLKNHWNSASLDDYNELGFNLRSNIFQGEGTHIPCLTLKADSIYTLPGLRAATLLWTEI